MSRAVLDRRTGRLVFVDNVPHGWNDWAIWHGRRVLAFGPRRVVRIGMPVIDFTPVYKRGAPGAPVPSVSTPSNPTRVAPAAPPGFTGVPRILARANPDALWSALFEAWQECADSWFGFAEQVFKPREHAIVQRFLNGFEPAYGQRTVLGRKLDGTRMQKFETIHRIGSSLLAWRAEAIRVGFPTPDFNYGRDGDWFWLIYPPRQP